MRAVTDRNSHGGAVEQDGVCREHGDHPRVEAVAASVRQVRAPALHLTVGQHGAGGATACSDVDDAVKVPHDGRLVGEVRSARAQLSHVIVAPAVRGTVCLQCAHVQPARRQLGDVRETGHRGRPCVARVVDVRRADEPGVTAPALHGRIRHQGARRLHAGHHLPGQTTQVRHLRGFTDDVRRLEVDLPVVVQTPAVHVALVDHCAGVRPASARH